MKKIFLRSLSIVVVLFPAVLHAFNADLTTWKSVYPNSTLGNSLSCNLCHGSSSKSKANATPYGNAVWGTSPISSAAIKAAEGLDSDGDGATNLTEINANTNPNDPNSKPGDTPPVAKITVSKTTFTVGETATFSGSTSTDDKGITKYEWDLNGDNTIDANGVTASTTYAAAGAYKVTLKVTDTVGQTSSASVNITVNAAADTPPIAKITASKTTVGIGETVTLNGSTSSDDKGISKYEWDFTSDGSIDATGVSASTSYSTAGSYKVTLKVTDTIGQTNSVSVTITVTASSSDTPPVAKITASKITLNIGEVVNLSGSGSIDNNGITKYEWDFTSNGSIDAVGVNTSTSYPSAGTYKVTLKVTDTIGQTGSTDVNITVKAAGSPPPKDDDDKKKKDDEKRKKEEEDRKKKEEEKKKKEEEDKKKKKS